MKYQEGKIGRTFLARLEHGDDMLLELKKLAEKEKTESALIFLIGALKSANMVVGPKECIVPPEGMPFRFDDGREIVGIGTIFLDDNDEPVLHVHGSAGREQEISTGCVRSDTEVYLLVEAVILELVGFRAKRTYDPLLKLSALSLINGGF